VSTSSSTQQKKNIDIVGDWIQEDGAGATCYSYAAQALIKQLVQTQGFLSDADTKRAKGTSSSVSSSIAASDVLMKQVEEIKEASLQHSYARISASMNETDRQRQYIKPDIETPNPIGTYRLVEDLFSLQSSLPQEIALVQRSVVPCHVVVTATALAIEMASSKKNRFCNEDGCSHDALHLSNA